MNDFERMDSQAKWEMTALNALEQAATSNLTLMKKMADAAAMRQSVDPLELMAVLRESQVRMARDIRALREITKQREKEQP